jgi:peroxiredoxin
MLIHLDTPTAGPLVEGFMPDFTLTSAEGQPVSTTGFHGLRSLVLVFVGEYGASPGFRLPSELARKYRELAGEGAEVLVIVRGTSADAARLKARDVLPFPVLADEGGQAHREFAAMTPDGRTASQAVFVAGRFGKLYLSSRAADGPPLPTAAGVLGALRYIEARCPECGHDEPL